MTSPYETLGVAKDATDTEVKEAFRRAASKTHPDRGGDGARMAAVNEAHAILSDPERRRRFDESGATAQPPTIEDEATQLLANIFAQAIQQDLPQVVEFAREGLQRMRTELIAKVAQATSKTARLEARREKVRTKDGAANLVHGLIDAQIAGITAAIANMNRGIQVAEAGTRLLEAYDEDVPLPEPSFSPWEFSTTAHTATGSWR